jgi:tetratricopeptide (TPR) repeat protein
MLELANGQQLADRYTLKRRLGTGGEAATWLAKDRLTGAPVALKIVANSGPDGERLRAEWQQQIRLMHAHIVRVFEFHSDEDLALYSQQFIDGPDLGALTGRPVGEVLPVIGLVADALRYVHGKGVVHRDIKASNILLDQNGAPYLSDFGVAANIGERGSGGSMIAQSPQSLDGDVAQSADDIFALGGLIYELVGGKPPYAAETLADEIRNAVPTPLRAADGTAVAQDVQKLVADMLDKEAAVRPTAEAVADRLRAAGFEPGTARIEGMTRPAVADEEVKTVTSVHPVRVKPTESELQEQVGVSEGISPRALGIGLGAALLLLLGVVFLLPATVDDDGPNTVRRGVPESAAVVSPSVDTVDSDDSRFGERRATRELEPEARGTGGEAVLFNENEADYSDLDDQERARFNVEMILGELLSNLETLRQRGVQRWAPALFRTAEEAYAAGDKAYLERNYGAAERHYLDAISVLEPLFDRIEPEFQKALSGAQAAFDAGDRAEALRLYELAVAITPNDAVALAGLERTRNLENVLRLVEQGLAFEKELELEAAEASFAQAASIDPDWGPAQEGLERVQATRTKMTFDQRMSEGFDALAVQDFLSARAAFRMAQQLLPESREPADGLLQVDLGLRLESINVLEREARMLEGDENWDAVITTYEEVLKIDPNLAFALEGLAHAREMSALHAQLDDYIAEPDKLSAPSTLQQATKLVVDITLMGDIGPRLAGQRDELSQLLKRAATPVPVQLESDNLTQVSVYKVGTLGRFTNTRLELRPGTYVAVGVRPGFRDVRREFRVAPELEMQPVVVRCEEPI